MGKYTVIATVTVEVEAETENEAMKTALECLDDKKIVDVEFEEIE